MATQVLSARVTPETYARLRETLDMPEDSGPTAVMLAAIAQVTGVPVSSLERKRGGRRPGAGRKPGRPAAA